MDCMALDAQFIGRALDPLRYLPLSQLYAQFSSVIDFFVYLLIFLGLAQWSLESRFQGRGGKALTVGIGTALALSLSLAENRFSFSIASLGVLAGAIALILVGIVLFPLAQKVGLKTSTAVMAVVALIYLGIGILTPEAYNWIDINAPLIHGIAAAALIALLVKAVWRVFHGAVKPGAPSVAALSTPEQEAVSGESRAIKDEPAVLAQERKDLTAARTEMQGLVNQLGTDPQSPQVQTYAHAVFRRAKDRDMVLRQRLDYIQTLNSRLERFDLGLFHEMKARYDKLPAADQARLRKEIDLERLKVFREREVEDLSKNARSQLVRLEAVLDAIDTAVSRGDQSTARSLAVKAARLDRNLERTTATLQAIEQALMKIIQSSSRSTR